MYCLDGTDKDGNKIDFSVSGADEQVSHRRLEIDFLPCIPVLKNRTNGD